MDLPQAVLFDFSGTLMRVEPAVPWLRAVVSEAGLGLDDSEIEYWAHRLEKAGGHNGGANPASIPEHLQELWDNRDFDAKRHEAAYSGFVREAGWPWPELVDALYERGKAAEGWQPYPDALETLQTLRDRGVRTALLSNTSWDVREPLKAAGLLPHLEVAVLSYEVDLCKPDPAIFALACERLGVEPARTVMVGDHEFDGGGRELGIRTFFVEHLPVEERPSALSDVLEQLIRT
jgi:HAD superfamily hydrolase (TIGR01509 family)